MILFIDACGLSGIFLKTVVNYKQHKLFVNNNKLWVNDTKNDKVPKINVTDVTIINDNLDQQGNHGTIEIRLNISTPFNFCKRSGYRTVFGPSLLGSRLGCGAFVLKPKNLSNVSRFFARLHRQFDKGLGSMQVITNLPMPRFRNFLVLIFHDSIKF